MQRDCQHHIMVAISIFYIKPRINNTFIKALLKHSLSVMHLFAIDDSTQLVANLLHSGYSYINAGLQSDLVILQQLPHYLWMTFLISVLNL